MMFHTEAHGFESEDLDAVAQEVGHALSTDPISKHYDGYGGDYFVFRPSEGGKLQLYDNQSRMDGEWQEEAYKEFGLILKIEQQGDPVDYAAKLGEMSAHELTLLYRTKFDDEAWNFEKLFELKPGSLKIGLSKAPRPNWLSGRG